MAATFVCVCVCVCVCACSTFSPMHRSGKVGGALVSRQFGACSRECVASSREERGLVGSNHSLDATKKNVCCAHLHTTTLLKMKWVIKSGSSTTISWLSLSYIWVVFRVTLTLVHRFSPHRRASNIQPPEHKRGRLCRANNRLTKSRGVIGGPGRRGRRTKQMHRNNRGVQLTESELSIWPPPPRTPPQNRQPIPLSPSCSLRQQLVQKFRKCETQ